MAAVLESPASPLHDRGTPDPIFLAASNGQSESLSRDISPPPSKRPRLDSAQASPKIRFELTAPKPLPKSKLGTPLSLGSSSSPTRRSFSAVPTRTHTSGRHFATNTWINPNFRDNSRPHLSRQNSDSTAPKDSPRPPLLRQSSGSAIPTVPKAMLQQNGTQPRSRSPSPERHVSNGHAQAVNKGNALLANGARRSSTGLDGSGLMPPDDRSSSVGPLGTASQVSSNDPPPELCINCRFSLGQSLTTVCGDCNRRFHSGCKSRSKQREGRWTCERCLKKEGKRAKIGMMNSDTVKSTKTPRKGTELNGFSSRPARRGRDPSPPVSTSRPLSTATQTILQKPPELATSPPKANFTQDLKQTLEAIRIKLSSQAPSKALREVGGKPSRNAFTNGLNIPATQLPAAEGATKSFMDERRDSGARSRSASESEAEMDFSDEEFLDADLVTSTPAPKSPAADDASMDDTTLMLKTASGVTPKVGTGDQEMVDKVTPVATRDLVILDLTQMDGSEDVPMPTEDRNPIETSLPRPTIDTHKPDDIAVEPLSLETTKNGPPAGSTDEALVAECPPSAALQALNRAAMGLDDEPSTMDTPASMFTPSETKTNPLRKLPPGLKIKKRATTDLNSSPADTTSPKQAKPVGFAGWGRGFVQAGCDDPFSEGQRGEKLHCCDEVYATFGKCAWDVVSRNLRPKRFKVELLKALAGLKGVLDRFDNPDECLAELEKYIMDRHSKDSAADLAKARLTTGDVQAFIAAAMSRPSKNAPESIVAQEPTVTRPQISTSVEVHPTIEPVFRQPPPLSTNSRAASIELDAKPNPMSPIHHQSLLQEQIPSSRGSSASTKPARPAAARKTVPGRNASLSSMTSTANVPPTAQPTIESALNLEKNATAAAIEPCDKQQDESIVQPSAVPTQTEQHRGIPQVFWPILEKHIQDKFSVLLNGLEEEPSISHVEVAAMVLSLTTADGWKTRWMQDQNFHASALVDRFHQLRHVRDSTPHATFLLERQSIGLLHSHEAWIRDAVYWAVDNIRTTQRAEAAAARPQLLDEHLEPVARSEKSQVAASESGSHMDNCVLPPFTIHRDEQHKHLPNLPVGLPSWFWGLLEVHVQREFGRLLEGNNQQPSVSFAPIAAHVMVLTAPLLDVTGFTTIHDDCPIIRLIQNYRNLELKRAELAADPSLAQDLYAAKLLKTHKRWLRDAINWGVDNERVRQEDPTASVQWRLLDYYLAQAQMPMPMDRIEADRSFSASVDKDCNVLKSMPKRATDVDGSRSRRSSNVDVTDDTVMQVDGRKNTANAAEDTFSKMSDPSKHAHVEDVTDEEDVIATDNGFDLPSLTIDEATEYKASPRPVRIHEDTLSEPMQTVDIEREASEASDQHFPEPEPTSSREGSTQTEDLSQLSGMTSDFTEFENTPEPPSSLPPPAKNKSGLKLKLRMSAHENASKLSDKETTVRHDFKAGGRFGGKPSRNFTGFSFRDIILLAVCTEPQRLYGRKAMLPKMTSKEIVDFVLEKFPKYSHPDNEVQLKLLYNNIAAQCSTHYNRGILSKEQRKDVDSDKTFTVYYVNKGSTKFQALPLDDLDRRYRAHLAEVFLDDGVDDLPVAQATKKRSLEIPETPQSKRAKTDQASLTVSTPVESPKSVSSEQPIRKTVTAARKNAAPARPATDIPIEKTPRVPMSAQRIGASSQQESPNRRKKSRSSVDNRIAGIRVPETVLPSIESSSMPHIEQDIRKENVPDPLDALLHTSKIPSAEDQELLDLLPAICEKEAARDSALAAQKNYEVEDFFVHWPERHPKSLSFDSEKKKQEIRKRPNRRQMLNMPYRPAKASKIYHPYADLDDNLLPRSNSNGGTTSFSSDTTLRNASPNKYNNFISPRKRKNLRSDDIYAEDIDITALEQAEAMAANEQKAFSWQEALGLPERLELAWLVDPMAKKGERLIYETPAAERGRARNWFKAILPGD